MFNMSKEEKFNFDIENLKQDFAIENMNVTDSDIEILKDIQMMKSLKVKW